jgi:outer membrane protein OmpA-like peptidoglycan-associated protein
LGACGEAEFIQIDFAVREGLPEVNKFNLLFIGALLMAPFAALAQDGGFEVQQSVKFAKNSSALTKEAEEKLRAEAESLSVLLRYRPESSVEIAGYAEAGEKKPGPLADARAQKVWEYLISQGLPAERMEPVGYGGAGKTGRVDIRVNTEDALAMNRVAQPIPAPTPEPAPEIAPTPAPAPQRAPAAEPPPVAVIPAPAPAPAPVPEPPVVARPTPAPAPPPEVAVPQKQLTPSEESWDKSRAATLSEAERKKRLKAEKDEAARAAAEARKAEQAAAAERKRAEQAAAAEAKRAEQAEAAERKRAEQQAALERKQAEAEMRKQQQVEALERKQAAAELRKQQQEQARLQAKQNAEEKKRQAEQEAMRIAMSQPPPTLTPEISETTLKSTKGRTIVDNQTAPSYTQPPAAPTPKSALPGQGSYFIQGTAYFAANARSLTPGSSATIDALAIRVQKLLQSKPNARVDIVGHADPLTEAAQADVLAEGRAEELVKELAARGIDRARLRAAGAADTQPLTSKKGDPARNLNMRAEIRVPN